MEKSVSTILGVAFVVLIISLVLTGIVNIAYGVHRSYKFQRQKGTAELVCVLLLLVSSGLWFEPLKELVTQTATNIASLFLS